MIEPISPINSRILSSRIQEDPQEVVGIIPIEEEEQMVIDHMIITEGEVGEIATRQILL